MTAKPKPSYKRQNSLLNRDLLNYISPLETALPPNGLKQPKVNDPSREATISVRRPSHPEDDYSSMGRFSRLSLETASPKIEGKD